MFDSLQSKNEEVSNNTQERSHEITYDSDAFSKESCVIEEGRYVIDYNRIGSVIGDWDDKKVDHLYERMNNSTFSDQLINLLICYVALSKSEHNLDNRFLDDGFKYSMVVKFLDDIIPDGVSAPDFCKKVLVVFCKENNIISKIGSSLDQNAEQIYNKIPSTGSLWLSKIFNYLVQPDDLSDMRKSRHKNSKRYVNVVYWVFLRMMHKERSEDPADAFNQQLKDFLGRKDYISYDGRDCRLELCPRGNIPMDVNVLRGIIKFLATNETDHLAPIIRKYHNTNRESDVIDHNKLYEIMNKSPFSDQRINLLICYVALFKSERKSLDKKFLDNKFKYSLVVNFLDDIVPDGVSVPDFFKEALLVFCKRNKIIHQIELGSSLDEYASQIYGDIPSTGSSWSNQILNHLLRPGVSALIEDFHKLIFRTKSRHDLAVIYLVFLRMMHKTRSEDPEDPFNQQFNDLKNRKNTIYYDGKDKNPLIHCPTYHIPMGVDILRGIIKFLATNKTDHLGPIISKYQEKPRSSVNDFPDYQPTDDHIGDILVSPSDSDIDVSRSVVADNLEKVEQTGIVAVGRLPSYKYNNTILEQCYTDEVRNSSSVPIDPNIEPAEMRHMLIGAIETLLNSNIISIKIDTLINYYIFSSVLISQGKDFNCLFRDLNLLMHSDKKVFKNNDFYKAKGYLIHYLSGIKKAILCDLKLKTFDQEALVRASAKFKSKFILACEHPAMLNRKLELDQAKAFYCDLLKLDFKHCCELINSVIKVEEPNIDLQSCQRKMQKDKLEELAKKMKELAKKMKEHDKEMAKKLEGLDKQLEENGKKLEENGKKLEESGKKLEESGKKLEESGKKLEEGGKKLEEGVKKLEEHDKEMAKGRQDLAKIIEEQSNNHKKGALDLHRQLDELQAQINAPQSSNSSSNDDVVNRGGGSPLFMK